MSKLTDRLSVIFGERFYENRDNDIVCLGESADGVPWWTIRPCDYDTFAVKFEIGWYEQEGEAHGEDELIALMNAMLEANKALNVSLRQAEELRRGAP